MRPSSFKSHWRFESTSYRSRSSLRQHGSQLPIHCCASMWQQHWPLSQTSAMITGLGAFQASWPCTICTAWTGTQGEVSKLVDMVDVIQSLVTSLWHQTSLMKNGDFPRFKQLSASWHSVVLNATMTEHVCGHALRGWTKDIVCTGLPTLCLVEIFEIFCWLAPDTSARNFNTLEFNEPDKATTITTRKRKGWNGSHPGEAKYHLSVMWGDMGSYKMQYDHTHTHIHTCATTRYHSTRIEMWLEFIRINRHSKYGWNGCDHWGSGIGCFRACAVLTFT